MIHSLDDDRLSRSEGISSRAGNASPLLFQWWASKCDGGTSLRQQWFKSPFCLRYVFPKRPIQYFFLLPNLTWTYYSCTLRTSQGKIDNNQIYCMLSFPLVNVTVRVFMIITTKKMKWNESGFRPPLCTYRLNWARRTSWGWWDDWDDTVLQTQDSKFEPWRSEAEHATSRSRRLPTILTFTRGWGRNNFVSFKPPRPGTEPRTLAWKAAVLTTTLGPPPDYNNKVCENIRVPPFNMQWGAGGLGELFEIIIINVLDNGIALSARDRLHTS